MNEQINNQEKKEQVIWEEKNLTEPTMNLDSCGNNTTEIIIKNTEPELEKKECESIGKKRNPQFKPAAEQILEIKRLYDDGVAYGVIINDLNLNINIKSLMKFAKRMGWTRDYTITSLPKSKIKSIKPLYDLGMGYIDIITSLQLTIRPKALSSIICKLKWSRNISKSKIFPKLFSRLDDIRVLYDEHKTYNEIIKLLSLDVNKIGFGRFIKCNKWSRPPKIISPRKWQKNCPTCGQEQIYKSNANLKLAIKNNTKCSDCKQYGRKHKIPDAGPFIRKCPECGKDLKCSTKKYLLYANRKQSLCYQCVDRPRSQEYREKIRKSLTGRTLTEEHRNNVILAMRRISPEKRKEIYARIAAKNKGRISPTRGSKHTQEHKDKIRNSLLNLPAETKQRIIDYNKTHLVSDETRRKMRLSSIKNIEKKKYMGAQMKPAFSFAGCEYFDKLALETGWTLKHAMNGGEHYLKELGYWLDAYDEKLNIAIEYDEGYHNNRKEKDSRRMNEIKSYLKCRFFRYDSVSKELKEY